MDANDVLALGLGVTPPWPLADQRLDTSRQPHVLEILLEADRGAEIPCPESGGPCKAHDFKEFTWWHLNFFQHHCLITARVPRTDCPEHGVKRASVRRSFTDEFKREAVAEHRKGGGVVVAMPTLTQPALT